MAIVQRRLMQVTRALDTLSGVHLAARVFDAAHMAMAMAVGRWPLAVGRWPLAVYSHAVLSCPERSSPYCCYPSQTLMMAFIIFP